MILAATLTCATVQSCKLTTLLAATIAAATVAACKEQQVDTARVRQVMVA
jgi:hypothetical protein